MSDTKITVVNTESYGRHSTPEIRTRYTMEVEFILDMVPGAWHQPEDLMNWIATHSYVTQVTHEPVKTVEEQLILGLETPEEEKPQLMFHKLKVLHGFIGNGSDAIVKTWQTSEDHWTVQVNDKLYSGSTLSKAIDSAYEDC